MEDRRIVETTLRVRYAETDTMGVVHHASYLVWFEVGRGEYFRALGQDYGQWEDQGVLLPVSELQARYQTPAVYGDVVTVGTWLREVRSRTVTLGYQVCHANNGQPLATGWSKHICADAQGRARRLPPEMLQALENA